MNAVYEMIFGPHPPARTTVEAAHLPKDSLVEIDAIALDGEKSGRPEREVPRMKTQGIVGGVGPESTVDYYRSPFQIWREETMDGRRRGKTFLGYVFKVGY